MMLKTLPWLPPSPTRAGVGRPSPTGAVLAPPPAPLCVLVADDDRDTAESYAVLLGMWGHTVCLALDGAEARDLATLARPDVVLADLAMPGMDGFRLARHVREEIRLPRAVLIAVTGLAGEEFRRRALEAGFDHFFPKPAAPSALEGLLYLTQSRRVTAHGHFRIDELRSQRPAPLLSASRVI
jgi:CheY-like chemotaxis protein